RLRKDENSILKLIRPLDSEQQALAQDIVDTAARLMEEHLGAAPPNQSKAADVMDSATELHPDSPMQQSDTPADPGASALKAGNGICNSALLEETLDEAKEWILWQSLDNKKDMYGPIGAFIEYVALVVQEMLTSLPAPTSISNLGRRLVLPSTDTDYTPIDARDRMRIGMGLARRKLGDRVDVYRSSYSYYDMLGIIEAKVEDNDEGFEEAFKKLLICTRQMYQQQHHLSFAWGITIGGCDVRMCHFGPDKAASSSPMNVFTPEGRRAFIEVLVHCSLCEESQLGRDTSMEHLPELNCWKIACPDETGNMGEGATTQDYYLASVRYQADRVFGRHTRCFLATKDRPTVEITDASPLIPTVVIKDSWVFSKRNAADDTHDEVRLLKKIKESLSAHTTDKDIIIPEIMVGGRVSFQRNGEWVNDTTSTMYQLSEADSSDDSYFRAHHRIVMSPIGEPLHTTKSVAEFVTVVCDAMHAHSAIVEHCNILHRDISDNNILVIRRDGIARGMLIDFDYAIDMDLTERDQRIEMTGTDPYMSINNLSGSNVERTSLDDWESMLCLICLFATIGITAGNRRTHEELEGTLIRHWRDGTTLDRLWAKQSGFSDYDFFMAMIVNNFKLEGEISDTAEKNNLLRYLAVDIHEYLFQNPDLSTDYHGTYEKPKYVEQRPKVGTSRWSRVRQPHSRDSLPTVNPFEERVKKWREISGQLLAIVDVYRKNAMKYQREAIGAMNSATVGDISL
ncbi:hypothetical protein FBU31_000303, partial [Coemansia sp. 'formosensis']